MNEYTPNQEEAVFGFSEEWEDFRKRHTFFLERFHHINDLIELTFTRVMQESELIERFVMLYGRLCVEDFFEIMLCCANGYGYGGLKLLRGFYEKAVTLEYLNDNPNELNSFLDYRFVSEHKILQSVNEVFGPNQLPPVYEEEVKRNFARVKDQYLITSCPKCATKRVNISWTKLSFPAMAQRTRVLGKLVHSAYYIPMRHTHSTGSSLIERLHTDQGIFGFNPGPQRHQADSALLEAHTIILEVLLVQQKRFNLEGFLERFDKCVEDWKEIHGVDDAGNLATPHQVPYE
jgi:hypothetical protein